MDLILAIAIFGAVVATFDIYWVLRLFLVQLISMFRQSKSVTDEFFSYRLFFIRSILHQLNPNITVDYSLNYKFSTRKLQVQCVCVVYIFWVN